jgi:hypothetical protein
VARIVKEVEPDMTVIITPMPRYLDPCCAEHRAGKSQERVKDEQEKHLRAVWSMKKETIQLVLKGRVKNTIVV